MVPTAPEVDSGASAPGGDGQDESTFDVVIIGGGPGGYATALYGAAAGLRMAMVEMDKVGGTCLHRGCVPAKEFLETAAVYRTVSDSARFGINAGPDAAAPPTVDFSVSQTRKQEVVDQLFKGLSGLLKGRGVHVFNGSGTLLPGPPGAHQRQRRHHHRDHRHRCGTGLGLGPTDHPGLRHRR